MPANRLIAESYVQWDPLWLLRLGAAPFWLQFNMRPSYDELLRYLTGTETYDHIDINLFSHGLWSPGVVSTEQWRGLAESAARIRGDLIGVDEHAYPADIGSSLRFQPAFRALPPRHPLPPPLPVEEIDRFLAAAAERAYSVDWI
jgi:hypothetical protein